MLTISKALSLSQAKKYYQKEYTSSRENYYSEQEQVIGQWQGKLAEKWGLTGAVSSEQYERLCEGKHPSTDEQMVKHVKIKSYYDRYGKAITTLGHRVGWDATFSAPKTVSIAAVVAGDERIRIAHQESVKVALSELEEYTQARLGGSRPAYTTGQMIAAKFEHDAARPDRETGYAAPQLHTHVVIFNVTEVNGRVKSLQPLELYRSQQYATSIYRINLAERLQKLGYEIEIDRRTGAPEIRGFTPEYINESSPRSREVQREAEQMKHRLEQEGYAVKEGAGLRQAAAKAERARKQYNQELMRARVLELDSKHNHQAQQIYQQALARAPITFSREEQLKRAQEALTFACENAVEREALVDKRKLMVDAYRRNIGLTSYDAVKQELKMREARGELINLTREGEARRVTTEQMLKMERENIAFTSASRNSLRPLIEQNRVSAQIAETNAKQEIKLNQNQVRVIEEISTSRDKVIGLQGGAGTGKTTTLSTLRQLAEEQGYKVQGFAPTTRASKALAESGIETTTLQKFISSKPENDKDNNPKLYIVDESSLTSTRNIHQFFSKVKAEDRVLLVGDIRQHQAVEAGSPFEQFQKYGMATSSLTEIIRQRDENLKLTVEKLSTREVKAAVEQLKGDGCVVEIANTRARLNAIAKDYCEQPDRTLVIAPANAERIKLNNLIHDQLSKRGMIGQEEHQLKVYVNRQEMTGAERTFANSYIPREDIIRYSRGSKIYGIEPGEYARVAATNHQENTITVIKSNGSYVTYNPNRLSGVSIYKEEERAFTEGDRVQFRAPFEKQSIANGELGIIEKIENHQIKIALDNSRTVQFNLDEYRHLDLGYAVTSYSSQGQTVDRVLIYADTSESEQLLNDRMGYVAISRARDDARIYTNDSEELGNALERQCNKEMAIDALISQDNIELPTIDIGIDVGTTSESTKELSNSFEMNFSENYSLSIDIFQNEKE